MDLGARTFVSAPGQVRRSLGAIRSWFSTSSPAVVSRAGPLQQRAFGMIFEYAFYRRTDADFLHGVAQQVAEEPRLVFMVDLDPHENIRHPIGEEIVHRMPHPRPAEYV